MLLLIQAKANCSASGAEGYRRPCSLVATQHRFEKATVFKSRVQERTGLRALNGF
jgi:hypothetical protein